MANKQQTAVDWYVEQVDKLEEEDGYLDIDKLYWLKQEALKMEREQIEKAFDEGQEYEYQYHVNSTPKFDSCTYFNETYAD